MSPREVDSDFLAGVKDLLGLAGQGAQGTAFEEETLVQVFDVGNAVRRGGADIATGGWFYGVLQNAHGAANTQFSAVDPYSPGSLALGSWPAEVPADMDVWVGNVYCISDAVVGINATFSMGFPSRMQGLGVNQLIAPVAAADVGVPMAWWDEIVAMSTAEFARNALTLQTCYPVNIRVPRGAGLQFTSVTAGIATLKCVVQLGLFPAGAGQDVGY